LSTKRTESFTERTESLTEKTESFTQRTESLTKRTESATEQSYTDYNWTNIDREFEFLQGNLLKVRIIFLTARLISFVIDFEH
jgi:hypothetical protein